MSGAGALRLPSGFRVVRFEAVGSTNDEAKALARDGAHEGTIVWALRQESGRGRRGRSWTSPEGNLYTTTVLRPACAPALAAQVSFVAALAISDTVIDLLPTAYPVRCKWPNDVLVNGRKVSGILLESEPAPEGTLDWLVLGVGINLAIFPDDTGQPVTSVLAEGGRDAPIAEVLEVYAGHLARRYDAWRKHGFAAVRADWLDRATGLGQRIVVRLADREIPGTFADLDMDGVLLLDRDDGGGRQRIAAGDVFLPARPAPSAGI